MNNIIPLQTRRPINDLDVMVQLCNSPDQHRRRMERRQAAAQQKTSRAALTGTALLFGGMALGFLTALCLLLV